MKPRQNTRSYERTLQGTFLSHSAPQALQKQQQQTHHLFKTQTNVTASKTISKVIEIWKANSTFKGVIKIFQSCSDQLYNGNDQ